ncbi:MAG: hypothetical protein GX774_04515 [Armatimonadetes bacterium]|nr:hypothetical protein [Armatimonadota bacterium]
MRRWLVGLVASALLCLAPNGARAAGTRVVRAGGLEVSVTDDGHAVVSARGARAWGIATRLAGCVPQGTPVVAGRGGRVEVTWRLAREQDGRPCTLVEQFRPGKESIRWEIAVTSDGEPWSTAVETHLSGADPSTTHFWTAWGDPRPVEQVGDWRDPLQPAPFTDRTLTYGGVDHTRSDAFCLPIATLLERHGDRGLSLVLSPEECTLELTLATTAGGTLAFARRHHRLGGGKTQRFAMDLVAHPADWRAGVGWMARRYPRYFDPPNPRSHAIAGLGAYSSYEGELDAARLMAMGFRVNWKASYDFPYMGMFLPPVADDVEWTNFKRLPTSIRQMRDYARRMRRAGFSVLSYFNVTEFGAYATDPAPPRKAQSEADLWRDANDFLHYHLGEAILRGPDGKPFGSWEGALVMDPGEPVYQRFLLAQARRHLEKIPDSDGICIDRLDWLRFYNPRRDDGVSWVDGKPARSLLASWESVMGELGPLMHRADKVIYCNPLNRRLDLMRQIDGIYDEMADQPHSLNLCALLGVRRPVMGWIANTGTLGPDPDVTLQRYLHLGVFPTAPFPGNDHTITPDAWAERFYLDYGPLFDALRGRTWVLRPHVVTVTAGQARANLFAVPGGYVLPVTGGGDETRAEVVLNDLPLLPGQEGFRVEVIHPAGEWRLLKASLREGRLTLTVPLRRGCAVVRLLHTWILPHRRYFVTPATVTLGSTLRGAVVRYTLDGSAPLPTSPRYTRPLRLQRTTTLRAAAYRQGARVGPEQQATFVRVPPPAPTITPERAIFTEAVTVSLQPSLPETGTALHYTLDGSEPTAASPRYTGALTLTESTLLKARVLVAGAPPGRVATADLRKLPPLPPLPDVYISDLTPLKATVGWGEVAKKDRSIEGRTLCLAGTEYAKGMGVSAVSELVYPLQPEYRAFVAIVGIDHEMKDWNLASVIFRVLVDGKVLAESPLIRQGDVWHLHVPLPPGGREITLFADDAGDTINCDHADWVNAGFLTR